MNTTITIVDSSNWNDVMKTERYTSSSYNINLFKTFKSAFPIITNMCDFHDRFSNKWKLIARYKRMNGVEEMDDQFRMLLGSSYGLNGLDRCICNKSCKTFGAIVSELAPNKIFIVGMDCLQRFGVDTNRKCNRCGVSLNKRKKTLSYCNDCEPLLACNTLLSTRNAISDQLLNSFLVNHPVKVLRSRLSTLPYYERCVNCKTLLV